MHYISSVSSNTFYCIALLHFLLFFHYAVRFFYCFNVLQCIALYIAIYKKNSVIVFILICHFILYIILYLCFANILLHCIVNSVILIPVLFFSHCFVFCIDTLPISLFCIIFQMLLFCNYYNFFVFFFTFCVDSLSFYFIALYCISNSVILPLVTLCFCISY